MKKRILALAAAAMLVMTSASAFAADDFDASKGAGVDTKVALITMDQMDVHWVRLKNAAEERVKAYNDAGAKIDLNWLAPETKDNAQQIQKIETAIADGANYIIISANDATSCNKALEEAIDAGIKIIYVDATATVPAAATYATDNYAGGVQAGEYMKKVQSSMKPV